MGKQIFDRIKKTMAVLLLVLFVVSVTAAAASATQAEYDKGFKDGMRVGYKDGLAQCKKDQPKPFAAKAMRASLSDYDRGYAEGYDQGFQRGYDACQPNPVADFSASPRSGKAPLRVYFTDESTNDPTVWKWNFGDGYTSQKQDPMHKYAKAGKYTVSLTVKNKTGSDTEKKYRYIIVRR